MNTAGINSCNGILVIDKPADMSSARVVAQIKKMTRVNKAGHAGTLDPSATGVLVCCLNRATRLARFFLRGDKTYRAELFLGVETDTQDATGQVVAKRPVLCDTQTVLSTLRSFQGVQQQIPPVFSALKHQGSPLYRWARKGQYIEKSARGIEIYSIHATQISLPRVRFEVRCSSGTYVRSLCADIGDALGCGGHLSNLRRLGSSHFRIQDAVSLADLDQLVQAGRMTERLISMADALAFMPGVAADDALRERILNGKRLVLDDIQSLPNAFREGYFKITDAAGRLLAVMRVEPGCRDYQYGCVFPYE